jgi:hypothetical protein
MPEIKKQFTGGKMNKDVDERLVPTGEYRDAMNIQVSTSEGSDVGTIQNVLGNIPGCADFNSAIGDDAFTVGSISDEKNDTLYWLIAGRTEESLALPLNISVSVSFKDMIMSYNSSTGCTPVFVDKWKFCTGIDPNSSYYGSLTNSIVLDDTSLYSNITQGMFATGYNGPNTAWGPTLVNDVGLLTTIPVNYQSETTTAMVNSTPITDTAWISVRTFYELGCTGGPPNYNINRKNPCSPNQSQVSSTNIPPNGIGAQLWIHPSDWNPNIVVGSIINAYGVVNGYSLFQSAGAEVTAINFQQLCNNTNHPGAASGNMSGCINAYVLDIEPFIISGTPSSPYAGTNPAAFTPSYSPSVFDSEYNSYKSFSGTITPPPYPVYTPTNVIHIAPNSDQWLDEIYNIFYDGNGLPITGAFLEINNNIGAGSSWPQDSCIDPASVSAPIAGIYDDTFSVINCQTGLPQNALNLNPTGRPLTFVTYLAFGVESVILNDSVNMYGVDTVCFESERVLNFDKDRLITGINIIDDTLLWTDNFSEPKKINIGRSKSGTDIAGDTHTAIVNLDVGHSLTNWYQPIREEHITVIKKSPKSALSLQLEVGRDTSLNYAGITSIGAPTSITAPTTISDFSSIAIGDTISFNINADYDSNTTFSLAWQPGQFILLKEAPDTSNLPGTPLANWKIRGKILNQASNNFDSANGTVNVTIEIVGLNGVPDDPDPNIGYLSYVVDIENSKSKIFEYKFPRFSYRYKYSDNEYSTFAPWSEVAFLPTTFNYDPKKGWNKGMVNNIKSIKISGFRPSVYGLPAGKDVIEVDILYKEDSSPNVYLVETISPIDILQSGLSTIPWYSNEYIIDSETIKSTIESNQLLRPWDNVPKKALAQEVSGNRVIYGNYEQNYDLKVGGLKYKPNFTNSLIAWGEPVAGSPQKSIKSLRDYKLGVVFTDKYGRETPVIISESGGFKIDKQQSINANRLTVGLTGQPPAEMAYYKFYVKETSTEYYSIAMDRWYAAEDGNIWLAFPSADRNKIDLDTSLYLKKGKDNDSNAIENSSRYKVLAIENEAPEFIKTRKIKIGTVIHNAASSPSRQIFGVAGNGMALAPYVGGIPFSMNYINGFFADTSLSHLDEIKEPLYIQFYYGNDKSQPYKILQITSDRDVVETQALAPFTPTNYHITLEKPFTDDINFIFDNAVNPNHIKNNVKVSFIKAIIENKPHFDGRFFAKIENDGNIRTQITNSDTLLGTNYGLIAQKMVYLLEDDIQLRWMSELAVIDNGDGPRNYINGYSSTNQFYHPAVTGDSNYVFTTQVNWAYYYARSAYFGALRKSNHNAVTSTNRGFFDGFIGWGLNWSISNPSLNSEGYSWCWPQSLLTGDTDAGGGFHENQPVNGVWFINRSSAKYTSSSTTHGHGDDDIRWDGEGHMNKFSPQIGFWNVPATHWVGPGISQGNQKMQIGFGGIVGLGDPDLWTVGNPKKTRPGYDEYVNWYLKAGHNKRTGFFDISNTSTIYKDIHHDFQKSLQAGNSFMWRDDPTSKVYTIDDATTIKRHTRFGVYDDGVKAAFQRTLSGSPSSYSKTWDFALDSPMDGWNPVNATNYPFIDSGLHLGRGEFLFKQTAMSHATGVTTIALSDITGIEIGMTVQNPSYFALGTTIDAITSFGTGGFISISNATTNPIPGSDPVFIGYTIFVVSSKIYGMGAPPATVINENWIEVNRLSTACSNGNLGSKYELQKGMMLSSYNIDSTERSPHKKNIIIKGIDPQNTSTGTYKIHLTGYKRPLHYSYLANPSYYNQLSANINDHEFSAVTLTSPDNIVIGDSLEFKQVVMNGVSNYTEDNTYASGQGSIGGGGQQHKSGGIGAVGYLMQFIDIFQTDYGDGEVIDEDPFVWETEPKDNTELDIYYEISENNPTVLNPDTINIAIPVGSKVASIAGAGGIPDDTYVLSVGGVNGNQIRISELAWVGPGNAPSTGTQPLVNGSTLEITRPNGTVLSVKIQNVVQMPTPPFTVSKIFELDPSLFNSEYKLNWHNCWSFGNGVESNRIKDTFNSPFIGHGVKVSTTSDDYKKEHRKSGLIYSGLYNSSSGINNLNQFIQAEKITKDVNPTYGSIQKLYAGWGQGGDLIALCEDRVLKILANKDALYNADGNSNITSTNNVLGTATPFAGNYGISKNPESFASESFRAYFTDKVRGAVIRLSMDGLTAISDHGMKDWFRDHLKLTDKLIGSYDDRNDEYVLKLSYENESAITGCMVSTACNYDPFATISGPCTYAMVNMNCAGQCLIGYTLVGGACVAVVNGCMDASACNYNAFANAFGICTYAANNADCSGACLAGYVSVGGACVGISGCTDASACNYDPSAITNDGTCVFTLYQCASGICAPCLSGPCQASVLTVCPSMNTAFSTLALCQVGCNAPIVACTYPMSPPPDASMLVDNTYPPALQLPGISRVNFTWGVVSGANGYSLRIRDTSNPLNLWSVLVLNTPLNSLTYGPIDPNLALPSINYEWQVRVFCEPPASQGANDGWSNSQYFNFL